MPDSERVADVVQHPVRLRVIQVLGRRPMTTAQLHEVVSDVSPATLYRHVAALTKHGFLTVVNERRVRGTIERTYALGDRLAHVDADELSAMTEAQLRSSFLLFLSGLAESFDRLPLGADAGYRELLGFGTSRLYVSPDDLPALQEGFNQLLQPYLTEAPGSQPILLSTSLIPDSDGEVGPGARGG